MDFYAFCMPYAYVCHRYNDEACLQRYENTLLILLLRNFKLPFIKINFAV